MAGQLGNTMNTSMPATSTTSPPLDGDLAQSVTVAPPAPVRKINTATLRNLGAKYKGLFDRFASERIPAEQKWLKNLRQYLGIYDPEIERVLPPNRSRAYPRLTRVKCISMLSRLMNLMFPGNEKNWALEASPSPEMDPQSVAKAINDFMLANAQPGPPGPDGQPGPPVPPQLTQEIVDTAIRKLAASQATALSDSIDDQLTELGGDQTLDWIALNRKVVDSGIKYGIGVLEGPFVRTVQQSGWEAQAPNSDTGQPAGFAPVTRDIFKPQYNFLPVWDFYPDMSARDLPGEGYFLRKVMGRSALRKLANRPDFFSAQIKQVINNVPGGNYKAKSFETELRTMGLSIQSDTQSTQSSGREKYEIIIWKGPVSAQSLKESGATVPDSMMADDVDAELWMIDDYIIKAEINPWTVLGAKVKTAHVFCFDEDDTSPVGQGLPAIVRDSQLSVCAATRMALDNASVICGPNLEVNTRLLRPDQDITAVQPYKIWYRDDDNDQTAQFPAVREINISGHLNELESLVKMFMEFAEVETFIGPATGGDMSQMPSEPMRTAAGASMLRGDAALPFKDIVRNYDTFTQSVIWSMVDFNKKFNPDLAPGGDYNVIARGATSLIAKEVRGAQIDQLSATLTPEERDWVDDEKFIHAKFASRDLEGMLVSPDVAKQRKDAREQQMSDQNDLQTKALNANIQKTSAEAFKAVTQGQKNNAGSDKTKVEAAATLAELGGNGVEGPAGGDGKAA